MARMIIPTSQDKSAARLQVSIHIQTEVLAAEVARRQANRWLLDHVGNLLRADAPELMLGDQLTWRFEIVLTSPERGWVGRLGRLEVDAKTGEVLADEALIQGLITHAETFAAS